MSIEMPSSFKALAESMSVDDPAKQWDALVERNGNEMPEPFSWRRWLERAPKKKAPTTSSAPAKHHPMYPPVPKQEWETRELTDEERAEGIAAGKAAIEMLEAMSGKPKEKRKPTHTMAELDAIEAKHYDNTLEHIDGEAVSKANLEKAVDFIKDAPMRPLVVQSEQVLPMPPSMAQAIEEAQAALAASRTAIGLDVVVEGMKDETHATSVVDGVVVGDETIELVPSTGKGFEVVQAYLDEERDDDDAWWSPSDDDGAQEGNNESDDDLLVD